MKEKQFIKTNYHCHCTFCDGHNTAEEMVQEAIRRGFGILGFSSHAMYPFSSDWHIPVQGIAAYSEEIHRLAAAYADKLTVLCGFEADYVKNLTAPDREAYRRFHPDFLIGSVHYVSGEGGFFEADGSEEAVRNGIERYFSGNVKRAVQAYFALEREMLSHADFDIIGHPDLIRKQNGTGRKKLFDEGEGWYRDEIYATAEAIAKAGVCVEINTGAMARGYFNEPYPSREFLQFLHSFGVPVTINSDAHRCEHLDYAFDDMLEYIKAVGYTELAFYTADGFHTQGI